MLKGKKKREYLLTENYKGREKKKRQCQKLENTKKKNSLVVNQKKKKSALGFKGNTLKKFLFFLKEMSRSSKACKKTIVHVSPKYNGK